MANSLGIDLQGKRVVVKDGIYNVPSSEADRTFICKGGFGCRAFTMGQAIYGRFENHPELGEERIEGSNIEKLAE